MTFQELVKLKEIVNEHQSKLDYYIRSSGEYIPNGKAKQVENPFNLYTVLRRESIHGRDTVIEKQSSGTEFRGEEENRFLEDFLTGIDPRKKYDDAIGNRRIAIPKNQQDFDKLSDRQKRLLEKRLFKSLVISCAQLLNGFNRMDRTNEVYELKNKYISEYLAYAEMFNARFPESKMAFGFTPDDKGVAALTGSVPGYSRFSVHLGDPITAAKILFNANQTILSEGPALGFQYTPRIQRLVSQKGLPYVKYGECELTDGGDTSKILKTYNLRDIRASFNRYMDKRRTLPSGRLSDSDKRMLEPYKFDIETDVYDFVNTHEYPLDINEFNTGVVNCYNGYGVKEFSDVVRRTKDELELDIAFNLIFAPENFNKRERMYIAERAELPLDKLQLVQGFSSQKTYTDLKEATDYFITKKTKNKSEQEKLELLKKIGKVYRYYPTEEFDRNFEFLSVLDASVIGISEEALEQFKIDELLLLYSENKKDVQTLLNNPDYAVTLIEALNKNNAMDKLFDVIPVGHVAELIQSAENEDVDFSLISQFLSVKIKEMSQEEIEEVLNPEEFDMFRFETIIKYVDDDTKKDFLTKSIGAVKDMQEADSILRTTIEGMNADDKTIEKALSIYDQIRDVLSDTTRESRQTALDIELLLETQEHANDVQDDDEPEEP